MATAIPTTMPSGHKALTRRRVLTALPAFGAIVAVPMLEVPDAGIRADADGEPPHPVLSLPFVRPRTPAERAAGAAPRCFWAVNPTGYYSGDCGTGSRYARMALDYMAHQKSPHLLQWCVLDMMRLDREHSGIEIGFLSLFGRIATETWATNLRVENGGLA